MIRTFYENRKFEALKNVSLAAYFERNLIRFDHVVNSMSTASQLVFDASYFCRLELDRSLAAVNRQWKRQKFTYSGN